MVLNWIKCDGDVWCPFASVNLLAQHFAGLEGVYVIWHGGGSPATVYVGQGQIAARLQDHRDDGRILAYGHLGLSVTWAEVEIVYRDGVERYLIDALNPKVGARSPDVAPIAVNLPWS